MKNSVICQAAYEFDEDTLNLSRLSSLINITPTEQEINLLKKFEGDKEKLGKSETFFIEILKVPCFTSRLESLKFLMIYKELIDELDVKLVSIKEIFINIRTDKTFLKILNQILAIGNYLNSQNKRQLVKGFKLDILEDLMAFKICDNQVKLINFITKNKNYKTRKIYCLM